MFSYPRLSVAGPVSQWGIVCQDEAESEHSLLCYESRPGYWRHSTGKCRNTGALRNAWRTLQHIKGVLSNLHTKSCGLEFESAFDTTMLHLDISIFIKYVPFLKERLNDWFYRKMRPDNWPASASLGSDPFVTWHRTGRDTWHVTWSVSGRDQLKLTSVCSVSRWQNIIQYQENMLQ